MDRFYPFNLNWPELLPSAFFARSACSATNEREEESEDEAQHETDSGFAAFLQTSRAYRAKRMQWSGALFLR
jgi:hypothetical protein